MVTFVVFKAWAQAFAMMQQQHQIKALCLPDRNKFVHGGHWKKCSDYYAVGDLMISNL